MAADPFKLTWWKLWFRWRGRIGREWYWLGNIMLALVGGGATGAAFALSQQRIEYMAGAGVLALITAHSALAIAIKRLHDRNRSGWWIILYYLVPIGLAGLGPQLAQFLPDYPWIGSAVAGVIGLWTLIDLGFRRGTNGPNRHGEQAMDEPPIELPVKSSA
jgi:uncharacterized membrane protein YhaH (DUF805 family)